MKSISKTACIYLLLVPVFLLMTVPVSSAEYFTIKSFHSNILIGRDSSVTVTERIVTLFSRSRHGIYRDIPVRYTDDLGRAVTTPLRVISVTGENGKPRKYSAKYSGNIVRIRIGDPKRYVRGRQVYSITYEVQNALLFLDGHDELYWNVTGNNWRTSIGKASASVVVKGVRDSKELWTGCYTGRYGSTERACSYSVSTNSGRFSTNRPLRAGEGLTIAFGWDKGIVNKPSRITRLLWTLNLRENWVFLIPLLGLFLMYGHWRRKGRDPEVAEAVTVLYAPPEAGDRPLLPAEVGVMTDERLDPRDLTASIVNLAVKGYISIEPTTVDGFIFDSTDYYLNKIKGPDEGLDRFENGLLTDLFAEGPSGIMVSDLKNKFYRKLDGLRNTVYDNLISRGYFNTRPDRVRKVYLSVGISVAVLGVFAGIFLGDLLSLSPLKSIAAFVVTGGIIAAFSRVMPAKTVRGAKIYQACRGFEEFLTRAEKDRLERMADKKLFEKYLPYAIALDVSDRWAKAFDGIYQEPPGWYVSPRGYVTFDAVSFNRSLDSSLTSMGQAMFTAPRSSGTGGGGFSGGGSSGGGFGGGGGGSW